MRAKRSLQSLSAGMTLSNSEIGNLGCRMVCEEDYALRILEVFSCHNPERIPSFVVSKEDGSLRYMLL